MKEKKKRLLVSLVAKSLTTDANFGAENEFCGNAWTVSTRRIQEMCLIFQTVRCSSTSIVLRSCVPRGRPDVCTMVAVDTRREVGTGSSNLDPCSSVRMYTQARATTCPACSTRVCLHLLLPLSASLFLRTLHHLTSLPHVIFSHLFFPPPYCNCRSPVFCSMFSWNVCRGASSRRVPLPVSMERSDHAPTQRWASSQVLWADRFGSTFLSWSSFLLKKGLQRADGMLKFNRAIFWKFPKAHGNNICLRNVEQRKLHAEEHGNSQGLEEMCSATFRLWNLRGSVAYRPQPRHAQGQSSSICRYYSTVPAVVG